MASDKEKDRSLDGGNRSRGSSDTNSVSRSNSGLGNVSADRGRESRDTVDRDRYGGAGATGTGNADGRENTGRSRAGMADRERMSFGNTSHAVGEGLQGQRDGFNISRGFNRFSGNTAGPQIGSVQIGYQRPDNGSLTRTASSFVDRYLSRGPVGAGVAVAATDDDVQRIEREIGMYQPTGAAHSMLSPNTFGAPQSFQPRSVATPPADRFISRQNFNPVDMATDEASTQALERTNGMYQPGVMDRSGMAPAAAASQSDKEKDRSLDGRNIAGAPSDKEVDRSLRGGMAASMNSPGEGMRSSGSSVAGREVGDVGGMARSVGDGLRGGMAMERATDLASARRASENASMNDLDSLKAAYRNTIAAMESGGDSGNYHAIGKVTDDGDRAYGRYQMMGKNIPSWTRDVLGQQMTPMEFLRDPAAQDAVFDKVFGGYVAKHGIEGAAQAWFGGEGSVGKNSRKDINGMSVSAYGKIFSAEVNRRTASRASAPATTTATANASATGKLKGLSDTDFAKLTPDVQTSLSKFAELQGTVTVNSGFRDPVKNKNVGGVSHSQHLDGNAVDVSIAGMSDEQKAQTVANARKAGFTRIGAYSSETALHLDMATGSVASIDPKWSTDTHPMFDKTIKKMDRAPDWFKDGLKRDIGSTTEVASADVPATDIGVDETAPTVQTATARETLKPETATYQQEDEAPKERTTGQQIAATGVDIGLGLVPGIGMGLSLVNGALTLTGNRTLGERLIDAIGTGDGTGFNPAERDPDRRLYRERKEPKTTIAANPKRFEEKYLAFVDTTKRPTPAEKWGTGTSNYGDREYG